LTINGDDLHLALLQSTAASCLMNQSKTAYDDFAWFFNKHWAPEVATDFINALNQLVLNQLVPGAAVLDLCCGTGQVTAALCRRGFDVTGVDISRPMLRYARKAAPAAKFICADVRALTQTQSFDAVVSVFDSINHFLTEAELLAVFVGVRNALREDGVFVFDVNNERGLRAHWADYYSIVDERGACILQGHYEPKTSLGQYEITIFRLNGENWHRSDCKVSERCYTSTVLRRLLRQAGFARISIARADKDLGLVDHTGRLFFVCA
jgi:SAM-dependent methyltransferase